MDDFWYVVLWMVILVLISALIFFSVHLLVNIIDLENDFLNPIDMCNAVNMLVLPEYVCLGLMVVVLALGGYWIETLAYLPLLGYNINLVVKNKHKLDPTVIYQVMARKRKHTLGILIFEVVSFFWFLYRFVYGLIRGF
mmetsp:Transcript_20500/g.57750  ORF Transcript_20500/g.57750 Transcript_20500/m.57750 type:complete len:139 (+) Transcript_20500:106-522(+)|eukprot:CAMPEP_0119155396 /NCGR_PEP_ID=MMETSP1310-20130426/51726_1 /TAXON_ID=464262 /ORGANISM="Genus nov. species nov., Strain RCC2339" /LENGTH=138 /DNA_ID=CAMNT_0007147993 /DNA_START=498 /DNA_END=914 /DNA_ORIENTATION=-